MDIRRYLRASELLKESDNDALAALESATLISTYSTGDAIFTEGDRWRGLHILLEGAAKVIKGSAQGQEITLHLLKAGDAFGEMVIGDYLSGVQTFYVATALAKADDTRVLCVPGTKIKELATSNTQFCFGIIKVLSQRVQVLAQRVSSLGTASSDQRVSQYLLRLARSEEGNHATVELPYHLNELASYLSMTPETLSRSLRRLRDVGMIYGKGQHYRIVDLSAMRQIAE